MILGVTDKSGLLDIDEDARLRHVHIVGQTGAGKSGLIRNMVKHCIDHNEGFALIDPHGQEAEAVLALLPPQRWKDVCYLDPQSRRPVVFNPFEGVPLPRRPAATDEIVAAFAGRWGMTDLTHPWQLRLLRHGVRLLLDCPETHMGTLLELYRDERVRIRLRRKATDRINKTFWYETDFKDKELKMSLTGVITRLETLLLSPEARHLLAQSQSTLDLRDIMDNGRILIINLAKGQVGEHNANLIGTFLVSSIIQAAFSRSLQFHQRPFYVFVDEFQNVVTDSFASALSEIRKYGVGLTLAHQYVSQVPPELMSAVIGNTGTTIAFRVGAEDAPKLAGQFGLHHPVVTADIAMNDNPIRDFCEKGLHTPIFLTRLANFTAWARVLQDGAPRIEYFFTEPPPPPVHDRVKKLKSVSRIRFGRQPSLVEREPGRKKAQKWR
jgi:hypothetical protein